MDSIENILQRQPTPGLHYLFFDSGKILYQSIRGMADIGQQKKITGDTMYHCFSITKTFTALAVLQLAEKALLEMDAPVKKFLPGFLYPPEITIKQLLTHSAGIPGPIPLNWIHLPEEHKDFDRDKFFGRLFAKHHRARFRPNEKFAYSNLGYVLLGQVLEKISGLPYEQYIIQNIIEKLDLAPGELGFTIPGEGRMAKGYHPRFSFSNALLGFLIDKKKFMGHAEGSWKPFKDYYINGAPYGGLIGSAPALVKYAQELLKPGGQLLGDELKQLLFRENHTNNGKPTGMCLSWYTGNLHGHTYYTHAGGGGGYYGEIRVYPGLHKGSVIMFNRTGMRDERFLDKTDSFFISIK